MKADLIIQLFVTFASLSLMAVGGVVAIVPELHQQMVQAHGWMDDAIFAHLFAIAQVAPGPNMMVVSLMGYHLAGWPGLIASTLGFLLPAGCLAVLTGTVIGRYEGTWQLAAIKAGLTPVALGLFAAGGVVICRVADQDVSGLGLSILGLLFTLALDWNPLWVLGAGAVLGAGLF
jgi:chromate transporter